MIGKLVGGQIQTTVEIAFCGKFFHGHPSDAVGMKRHHLVSKIFKGLPGGFGAGGNESEEGQGDTFFDRLRFPVALNHAADAGCSQIQDAA